MPQISGRIIGAFWTQAVLQTLVCDQGASSLHGLLFDGAPAFAFLIALLNLGGLSCDGVTDWFQLIVGVIAKAGFLDAFVLESQFAQQFGMMDQENGAFISLFGTAHHL